MFNRVTQCKGSELGSQLRIDPGINTKSSLHDLRRECPPPVKFLC